MKDLNSFNCSGRLTKDPEVQYFQQTDTSVMKFDIAMNGYKDDDTTYVRVEVWQGAGKKNVSALSTMLFKGTKVLIENGRYAVDKWQNEGQSHSRPKVVAGTVIILTPKSDNQNNKNQAPQQNNQAPQGQQQYQQNQGQQYSGQQTQQNQTPQYTGQQQQNPPTNPGDEPMDFSDQPF